ncbi:MAG: GNAT family N-acetyltransferase [Candidatus Thorarchaeota archaeon]
MEVNNISESQYDWLDLPEGFEFGIIETDEELEELIAFNAIIHDQNAGDFLKRIIENLPGFRREMNYVIRDSTTETIVACINSIPSTWAYENIQLLNLELGFVGTSESYRNKGLVNSLYSYFDRLLKEGQYDISVIQGIPYFYRKYGYDFILPLIRNIALPTRNLPDTPIEDTPISEITIRQAEEEDLEEMMDLLQEENQKLLVSSVRDERLWKVQERIKLNDSLPLETMVLESKGVIDGYFRIGKKKDGVQEFRISSVVVDEGAFRTYDTALRALYYFRDEAKKRNEHTIEIPGNVLSNLGILAMDYGGTLSPGWKYQVRIPDISRFLNTIRPVLSRRLKGTMFEGMTREVFINTYRTCYKLNFQDGELLPIEDIGMQQTDRYMEIRLPPQGFVRLILGEFTIAELKQQNVDFIVRRGHTALLETLFPKKESYIYHYFC